MTLAAATFPREVRSLEGVFGLVDGFLAESGLGESRRFLLEFVLEELFTNMVKYNPGGAGRIGVELEVLAPELRIQLSDPDCPSFDIRVDAPAVDAAAPIGARTPGGLGIHLVKELVDRIEYDHDHRTGTIRLYKKLE